MLLTRLYETNVEWGCDVGCSVNRIMSELVINAKMHCMMLWLLNKCKIRCETNVEWECICVGVAVSVKFR